MGVLDPVVVADREQLTRIWKRVSALASPSSSPRRSSPTVPSRSSRSGAAAPGVHARPVPPGVGRARGRPAHRVVGRPHHGAGHLHAGGGVGAKPPTSVPSSAPTHDGMPGSFEGVKVMDGEGSEGSDTVTEPSMVTVTHRRRKGTGVTEVGRPERPLRFGPLRRRADRRSGSRHGERGGRYAGPAQPRPDGDRVRHASSVERRGSRPRSARAVNSTAMAGIRSEIGRQPESRRPASRKMTGSSMALAVFGALTVSGARTGRRDRGSSACSCLPSSASCSRVSGVRSSPVTAGRGYRRGRVQIAGLLGAGLH